MKLWAESGVRLDLWQALLDQLDDRQKGKRDEYFIDVMFITAKKGGTLIGATKRGKRTKLMVMADGAGTPVGVYVGVALPPQKSGSLSRR
ncbi:MAG TPA: hypothetical protein VKB53_00785 [Gammaproteobacteria bacterium]|nr:hypothetical protein [Gammaproteobacteria bacterium]